MGLKIKYKLFIILVSASVLIIGCMFLFTRLSFERGLIHYVDKMQMRHLETMCQILEESYAREKSWDFITNNPGEWETFKTYMTRNFPSAVCRPNIFNRLKMKGGDFFSDNDAMGPGPMGRMHRNRFGPPLERQTEIILLDQDKRLLIGEISNSKEARLIPVMYHDSIVGWLGMVQPDSLIQEEEFLFFHRQSRTFMMIALAMICISIIVAVWTAYYLEGPIRVLTKGTRDLASGLFKTRIPVASSDELGQLSKDFNALASSLEENEKDRKKWVEDIAHELRTPLTLLSGELEAVEDGVRELTDDTIRRLKGDISHLIRLVNDLNELSRTDKGALSYKKDTIDLVSVINRVSERFRDAFKEAQLEFQDNTTDEKPIMVLADPERLSQLFGNIFQNALDYTNSGGNVLIHLEKHHDQVVIHVEDSAPGVPPESLPRLFDRLFRVESSRNRKSGGSGLGLAICKNIVEAHGGTIMAAPSKSDGLLIKIGLPLYHGWA